MFNENVLETGIVQGFTEEGVEQVEVPDLGGSIEQPKPRYMGLQAPQTQQAGIRQRDYDYKNHVGKAMYGAARQWGGVKLAQGLIYDTLIDNINAFGEDDPGFDLETALKGAGVTLTKEEHSFMLERLPRNSNAFEHYLRNHIEVNREDARDMTEYPGTSFVTGMLDPVYLAAGAGGGVIGRSIQAGRLGSAGISVGVDSAVMAAESYYNPYITDSDFAANVVLGGGLGLAFGGYKPREVGVGRSASDVASTLFPESTPDVDAGKLGDLISRLQSGEEVAWKIDSKGERIMSDEGVGVTFGNSHFEMTPEVQFSMEAGVPEFRFTGKYDVDTPTATSDVAAVRREFTDTEGGFNSYNTWNFIKRETTDFESHNGIPKASDIDWSYKNSLGIPIEKSALKAMYKIADDINLDPIIRNQAQRMIALGGKQLADTKYTYTKVTKVDPNAMYAGKYKLAARGMEVRELPKLYKQDPTQTTMHEAMHVLTSAKLIYGENNPGTVHGKLFREVDALRKHLVKTLKEDNDFAKRYKAMPAHEKFSVDYALSNTRELFSHVAEITSTKNKFLKDFMDGTEVPRKLKDDPFSRIFNITQALVDNLRKLMGLNIREGNALAKAFGLQDDVLRAPEISVTHVDGRIVMVDPTNSKALYDASVVEADKLAAEYSKISETVGKGFTWNLYRTASNYSQAFADKWLNDPLGRNGGNIQQVKNAIRTDFVDKYRVKWESKAMDEMKRRGVKIHSYVTNPKHVRDVQNQISMEVSEAMIQIERGTYDPTALGLSKDMQEIVAVFNDFGKDAAKQLVDRGLLPKEVLDGDGGYFTRRWNGEAIDELITTIEGMIPQGGYKDARTAAIHYLGEQMAKTFRFKGTDPNTLNMYGVALIRRALDQADGTDLIFRGHMGNEAAYAIRKELQDLQVDPKSINNLMDIVTGKINQAGKQRWQKTRMDLDMGAELIMPNGAVVRVADMMDTKNLFQTMPRYLDEVSGHLAMAEHGIKDTVDLDNARNAFVKEAKGKISTQQAHKLFDNIHAATLGRATGEEVHVAARIMSGMTQMVALRNSGFWQITELAKSYMRGLTTLGFTETNKMMGRAFGEWRKVKDPDTARQLNHILSRKSFNEIRMRPYVDRFEDGFTTRSNRMSAMQHAQGLVYHVNGMSTVQRLQANFAANVLTANLDKAAKGDPKLRAYFERLGMDSGTFDLVKAEIDTHGLSVDAWNSDVWAKVNPVLTSIMDTDVLKASLGDIPAFFQFSETGKVVGTFMNFTLSAQNRILANTLHNDGAKAFALMTAIQIPLALLATQVASISSGRGAIEDNTQWAAATMGQMGSFGALTEIFNVVSGNSKGFGGAMTISVDKASDVFGKTLRGEFGAATEAAAKSTPLISLLPGWGLGVETLMGGD